MIPPRIVNLSCLTWPSENSGGIIIKTYSNIIYTNQVGGTACFHPVIEGVFVPCLVNDDIQETVRDCSSIDLQLFNYQPESYRYGWAKIINKVLDLNSNFTPFTLDIETDELHHEAWLHVVINEGLSKYSPFYEFMGCKGTLTWENSD